MKWFFEQFNVYFFKAFALYFNMLHRYDETGFFFIYNSQFMDTNYNQLWRTINAQIFNYITLRQTCIYSCKHCKECNGGDGDTTLMTEILLITW